MTLDELMEVIMQRLVDARVRAGLSQHDVAVDFNVSPVTVSRWETGTRSIDLPLFIRLCGLYNVPPAMILTGQTDAPETRLLQAQYTMKQIRRLIDNHLTVQSDGDA